MSYKIGFKKSVARDLKKIDKAQADRILRKIEDDLPEKAEAFPVLTGKFSGLRKFRVGDYRIRLLSYESAIGEKHTAKIKRHVARGRIYTVDFSKRKIGCC